MKKPGMMAPALTRKLGDKIRHGLLVRTALRQLDRIGLHITIYYIEKFDYSNMFSETKNVRKTKEHSSSDFEYEFLPPERFDDILALPKMDVAQLPRLRRRLSDGNSCFVVRHRGRIVGLCWCALEDARFFGQRMELASNEAYLYGTDIDPSFRGQGLAPRLRMACCEALYREGIDTFYSYTEYFNRPALRFKQKLNAEILRLCLYVRFFEFAERNIILRSYTKNWAPHISG